MVDFYTEQETIEADFVFYAQTASALWGGITGTLSNQTDLINALNAKYDTSNPNKYIPLTALSSNATGLSYSNTTGVFSLTNGYEIPLASTLATFITKDVNNLANYMLTSDINTALNGKQNTISDLSTIRSNASNGESAYTTIQGYGNIVTHNANEFYLATNPNNYISGIDFSMVITALGYTPYNSTNPNHYISGITNSDVITALGYTPYNSTNPNNYITSSALNGYATENFVTSQGYIKGITSSDVTTALGYIPYNSTNPNNYITGSALNGYATQTWVGQQGYITGITETDVTTALGYTPYNGTTNPNGYITNSALNGYATETYVQNYHDSTKQNTATYDTINERLVL